jgi:hypothetical protein
MPDDSGDGLTPATAKKTIAAAIAAVPDGNNVYLLGGTYNQTTQGSYWTIDTPAKNVTIMPDPASRPVIALSTDAGSIIRVAANRTGYKCTIKEISFVSTGSYYISWTGSLAGGELEVTDCAFLKDKPLLWAPDSPRSGVVRKIAFRGCTYSNSTNTSPVLANGFDTFTVDGGTWANNAGINSRFFNLSGVAGAVSIKNMTYTTNGNAIELRRIYIASIRDLEIASNVIIQNGNAPLTYGVLLDDVAITQNCVIRNNVFRYDGPYEYRGVQCGYDGNYLAGLDLSDNTFTVTNAWGKGNAIHNRGRVSNVTCTGNHITGFLYGIYSEASDSTISYNVIDAVNPLARWGRGYNVIAHNTLVSHGCASDGGRAIVFGRLNQSTTAIKSASNNFTATGFTENVPAVAISPGDAIWFGSNYVGIPCISHPFQTGDMIDISGTRHYNGRYKVEQQYTTSDYIAIRRAYSPETFDGSERIELYWDLSKVVPDGEMLAICYSTRSSSSPKPEYYGVVTDADPAGSSISVEKWVRCSDQQVVIPDANACNVTVCVWSNHNTVMNNIFDGSGSWYTMTFDFNPQSGENNIDYNCYLAGSKCLSNLGLATIRDLVALRNTWLTWPTEHETYRLNDQNSIETDPMYADPDNGDFTPTNPAVLYGGRDENGLPTYMGAIGPGE